MKPSSDSAATRLEERDSRFLRELEEFTDDRWLIVCRRFLDDEKRLRSLARKAGVVAGDLVSSLGESINVTYYKTASAKVQKTIGRIPESLADGGRAIPVRSAARAAIECGRCALKLCDEEVAEKHRKNLAIPLLRPFEGLVTLPSLDFDGDRERGAREVTGPSPAQDSSSEKTGVFHLGFEEDYFTFTDPPPPGLSAVPLGWYRRHFFHETWELPGRPDLACRFGGAWKGTCAVCGNSPLYHLITIPVFPGLPVTGMKEAIIATCLSCLGDREPVLHFTHDEEGSPQGLFSGTQVSPSHSGAMPLRETHVHLCATPAPWARQKWENSADQNLNRIGGSPTWVQDRQTVQCPRCRKAMSFLLQLDSPFPLEDGGRWLWGSGGLLYLFWCDRCRIDAQFWQDS